MSHLNVNILTKACTKVICVYIFVRIVSRIQCSSVLATKLDEKSYMKSITVTSTDAQTNMCRPLSSIHIANAFAEKEKYVMIVNEMHGEMSRPKPTSFTTTARMNPTKS